MVRKALVALQVLTTLAAVGEKFNASYPDDLRSLNDLLDVLMTVKARLVKAAMAEAGTE